MQEIARMSVTLGFSCRSPSFGGSFDERSMAIRPTDGKVILFTNPLKGGFIFVDVGNHIKMYKDASFNLRSLHFLFILPPNFPSFGDVKNVRASRF